MLRILIFLINIIFLSLSIFFVVKIKKKEDVKKIRSLIVYYTICIITISYFLLGQLIISLDFLLLRIMNALTLILFAISFFLSFRKKENRQNVWGTKKMILLFAFPLFLYFIPHMYELYITKTCDSYISFDNIDMWGAESAYAIKGNTLKKVSLEYFIVNEKESDVSYYKYAMGEVTDAELEAYENSLPYKICDYDTTTCEVKGNEIVDDDGNIINNSLIVHAKEKSSSREFVLYEIPDCDITIVETYDEKEPGSGIYSGNTGYVYKADKYIGKINLTSYDGIDSVYLRKK